MINSQIGYIICESDTEASVTKVGTKTLNGKLVADVIFQTADEKNRNGRYYSEEELFPQLRSPRILELLSKGDLRSECGHPASKDLQRQSTIDKTKACARILKLWTEGKNICGHVVGTNNALGHEFNEDLKEGVCPAWSLRALGSVNTTRRGAEVKNLRIITWDNVIFPSHPGAYTRGLVTEAADLMSDNNSRLQKYILENSIESMETEDVLQMNKIGESGILIPISNQQVIDFIKEESSNLKFVRECFDFVYSGITTNKNGTKVILTTNEGDTMVINTEAYVHNQLMNYASSFDIDEAVYEDTDNLNGFSIYDMNVEPVEEKINITPGERKQLKNAGMNILGAAGMAAGAAVGGHLASKAIDKAEEIAHKRKMKQEEEEERREKEKKKRNPKNESVSLEDDDFFLDEEFISECIDNELLEANEIIEDSSMDELDRVLNTTFHENDFIDQSDDNGFFLDNSDSDIMSLTTSIQKVKDIADNSENVRDAYNQIKNDINYLYRRTDIQDDQGSVKIICTGCGCNAFAPNTIVISIPSDMNREDIKSKLVAATIALYRNYIKCKCFNPTIERPEVDDIAVGEIFNNIERVQKNLTKKDATNAIKNAALGAIGTGAAFAVGRKVLSRSMGGENSIERLEREKKERAAERKELKRKEAVKNESYEHDLDSLMEEDIDFYDESGLGQKIFDKAMNTKIAKDLSKPKNNPMTKGITGKDIAKNVALATAVGAAGVVGTKVGEKLADKGEEVVDKQIQKNKAKKNVHEDAIDAILYSVARLRKE